MALKFNHDQKKYIVPREKFTISSRHERGSLTVHNSPDVQTFHPCSPESDQRKVAHHGSILQSESVPQLVAMESQDTAARFHTLYQNKGYDIAVKVVTALLYSALQKKKKLHANLGAKVALYIDINTII